MQNAGYQKEQFLHTAGPRQGVINNITNNSDLAGNCLLRCGCTEFPFHYMQCNSKILQDARKLGIDQLEKSLYKMNTSPPLLEAIV
jgi:hypothetical protein